MSKKMAERSQMSELSTSKKLVRMQFLHAETNKILDCYLSPEDAQRVSVGNFFFQYYNHWLRLTEKAALQLL